MVKKDSAPAKEETLFEHSGVTAPGHSYGFDKLRYHVERWHSGREEAHDMLQAAGVAGKRDNRKPVMYHADFTIKLNRVKNLPTRQRDATIERAYRRLVSSKKDGQFGQCVIGEPRMEGSDYILRLHVSKAIHHDTNGALKAGQLMAFENRVTQTQEALYQLLHGIKESQQRLPDIESLKLQEGRTLSEHGHVFSGRSGIRPLEDAAGKLYYAACFTCFIEHADALLDRIQNQHRQRLTDREARSIQFRHMHDMMAAAKSWLMGQNDEGFSIAIKTEPLRLELQKRFANEQDAENEYERLMPMIKEQLQAFNQDYALIQHERKQQANQR